jgi:riboflavin kinase/FMN adenylyltransferase
VLGPDFRFGARRAGDRALLEEFGRMRDFAVVPVAPLCDEGGAISSSRIRTRLHEGDVTSAAALLGRPHDVEGVVIRGDQRGRTIGFPTANLQPQDVLLPADGVYAVVARRLDVPDAPCLGGVANLGVRPTVGAGRSVEVHLFDWHGDLYDAPLRVAFVARLREERRFAGLDALVTQIRRDADDARAQVHGREQEYGRWL